MKGMNASKEAVLTIGQHFTELRTHSFQSVGEEQDLLADSLYRVSLGEYQYAPARDRKYPYWRQLFRLCRAWVGEHSDGPYVEYKTEADCMSWGMSRLRAEFRLTAPIPWTAVIKRLRELQKAQTRA
jgi:hypothetical protein